MPDDEENVNLLPDRFGPAIGGALGFMYRRLPDQARAVAESHRAALFMLTLIPGRDGRPSRAWGHGLVLPTELPAGSAVEHAQRIAEELDRVPDYVGKLRTGDKLPHDVPILGFGFVYYTADPTATQPLRIVFVDLDGQPFLVTEAAVEVHPADALLNDSLGVETTQMCLYALKIVVRAVTHTGNVDALAHCITR